MKIATETNFRSWFEDILCDLRDKYPDKPEMVIHLMARDKVSEAAAKGVFDTKLSDIPDKEKEN